MTEIKHTEKSITELLRKRHKNDHFEAQARNTTFGTGRGIQHFDGFAVNWNLKHYAYLAYEIKVSRSDFLSDKKWENYLPYCDKFYFVCPWDIIKPQELPDEAGLIYVTKNGKGLRIIKDSLKEPGERWKINHVLRHILTRRIKK